MKNIAIILASGTGERFGEKIPKQFYKFEGKTILEHSIDAFENNKNIDEIILVTNPKFRDLAEEILKNNDYKKVTKLLNVKQGLKVLMSEPQKRLKNLMF